MHYPARDSNCRHHASSATGAAWPAMIKAAVQADTWHSGSSGSSNQLPDSSSLHAPDCSLPLPRLPRSPLSYALEMTLPSCESQNPGPSALDLGSTMAQRCRQATWATLSMRMKGKARRSASSKDILNPVHCSTWMRTAVCLKVRTTHGCCSRRAVTASTPVQGLLVLPRPSFSAPTHTCRPRLLFGVFQDLDAGSGSAIGAYHCCTPFRPKYCSMHSKLRVAQAAGR